MAEASEAYPYPVASWSKREPALSITKRGGQDNVEVATRAPVKILHERTSLGWRSISLRTLLSSHACGSLPGSVLLDRRACLSPPVESGSAGVAAISLWSNRAAHIETAARLGWR